MRRKAISNIMFYVTTVLLILTIVFCIGSTVKSESSNERWSNISMRMAAVTVVWHWLMWWMKAEHVIIPLRSIIRGSMTWVKRNVKLSAQSLCRHAMLPAVTASLMNIFWQIFKGDMTFFRIGVILLPYAAAEAMGKEKDRWHLFPNHMRYISILKGICTRSSR